MAEHARLIEKSNFRLAAKEIYMFHSNKRQRDLNSSTVGINYAEDDDE